MYKSLSILLFSAILCSAGELMTWNYKTERSLKADRMIFYAAKGSELEKTVSNETTPDGKTVLKITLKRIASGAPGHAVQVSFLYRGKLEKDRRYRIQFQYRGTRNGEIKLVPAQAKAPYAPLQKGSYRMLNVTPEWQTCTLDFKMEQTPGGDYVLPRMMLATYPEGGELFFGPATLSETPKLLPPALAPQWQMKTPDGQTRSVTLKDSTYRVLEKGKHPAEKTLYIFVNRFESPEDGFIQLGMAADWWFTASINGELVYTTEPNGNVSHAFKPEDHVFNIPVKKGENTLAVRVRAGSSGCRFVCGTVPYDPDPDASRRLFVITESAKYRPVANNRWLAKKGTALDFSNITGKRIPAGTYGRVIVTPQGKFAFEQKPETPVRFFGMNFQPAYWRHRADRWTKADIERFADAVETQGYNLVRIHYLCRYLLGFKIHNRPHRTIAEAGLPQSADKIEFDKGNLDRFDYLVKCFKDRGIYLNVDLLNAPGYSMAYKQGPTESVKTGLLFDPEYRNHWKIAVEYLMNRENPYTKTKMKDEPAIAFVNFFNEQDFILGHERILDLFKKPFQAYLRKKYGTEKELRKVWGTDATFESAGRISESVLRKGDDTARDTGDFLIATMREMTTWFFKTVREAGYPGLFNHWDMIMRTMEIPARSLVPAIAQHTYFAHPNYIPTRKLAKKSKNSVFMGGYNRDTTVDQSSALNSSYFRAAATARFFDRPYMITEYSHSSFNRYRHERGLYFASYAALQGWDDLTPHADTVRLSVDPLWCFESGTDPVSRASEVVAGFAFLRGDVKEAPHSIGLLLKDKNLFPKNYLAAIGDDYGKLSMLFKVGILYPEGKPLMKVGSFKPTLTIEPESFSPLRVMSWYVSADNSDGTVFPELAERLRAEKILPADNKTDWAKRIYQSETGELTLDAKNNRMTVVTPRLEGAILKPGQSADLPVLSVAKVPSPVSVAAASLNADKKLKDSEHILLTVATNAFNTNMTFENATMFCCVNPGDLPVLMESIQCRIELATAHRKKPAVYALHLDGTRFAEIPCSLNSGKLILELDTSKLKNGTPFFEIVY